MSIEKLIKEQTEALAANTAAIHTLIKHMDSTGEPVTPITAPAAAAAPAAPAPNAPNAPQATLTMTAKAVGVTYEQYMATPGWTDQMLLDQGLAIRPAAPAPAAAAAPAAPAAPAAAAPAAAAPAAAAPAPAAAMTPEELNNALVVEFRRLGSREGIDKAMAEHGVTSVNDLKPEQFSVLLASVQAIK